MEMGVRFFLEGGWFGAGGVGVYVCVSCCVLCKGVKMVLMSSAFVRFARVAER